MATTTPEQVRTALVAVTGAAVAEVRAVASAAPAEPAGWRAALFATAPLIVSEYAPGAATLGLDWFDELREDAKVTSPFTPTLRLNVTDDAVKASVARVTADLQTLEADALADFDQIVAEMLPQVEAEMQKLVAAGFRDTVTENADDDPDAAGWRRFTRGADSCKFCQFLAYRGAIYTKKSVAFAAHTNCHCVVGPAYDVNAPKADVMQYLASQKKRSETQKKRLREYLNKNFPDARG